MSVSVHTTNRANNIYLMGEGYTQGIHDTTLYVEKKHYRNFTDPGKKFVLSFLIMVMIVIYLLMVDKN